MMLKTPVPKLHTGLGAATAWGIAATLGLFATGLGWAAVTQISGAVIAAGMVEVSGRPKSVQHLDGGVIEDILISNGQTVAKGDVLLRLDDTVLQANLRIYRTRLSEASAEQGRLTAEQADATVLNFDPIDALLAQDEIALPRAAQTAIFTARRDLEQGRRDQLAEKILQFNNQTLGVNGLIDAKRQQLALVETELATLTNLSDKGLVRAPQLMASQREQADLLGQLAAHCSERARIQNSIRDTELEILQGQRQQREEVVDALRKVTTSVFELRQQIESTQNQLSSIDIRAPNAGRIHELQVTTIGGVVPPGTTILQIIPPDQGVSFRMRVSPTSVDQLYVGQSANLRFPAFDRRETPEIIGTLSDVSPTSVTDQQTGQSCYWATIQVAPEELALLGQLLLVPGISVEAYLQTGDRSVLSYLTKPMTDQIAHAFRE